MREAALVVDEVVGVGELIEGCVVILCFSRKT